MPPEDVKVDVASEEKDTSQELVEIPPKVEGTETDQLAAKIKADFEQLYGSKISQLQSSFDNYKHGAQRIQSDLQRKLEAAQAAPRPVASPDSKDFWSGIENGQQAKQEVERLAEQKAEEKLRAYQAAQRTQAFIEEQQTTQEQSKQRVVDKYPDLHPESGNPDTLISQTYVQVMREMPGVETNPFGPELVMYRMEERLKQAGGSTSSANGKGRATARSLAPSRSLPNGSAPLTLTREQKALCDRNGWDYIQYAKTAASLDANNGVLES